MGATLTLRMTPFDLYFVRPGLVARVVNWIYGWLTAFGMSPSYSYLLQTKGRKTGLLHCTPVNLLRHSEKLYLIGTRGHTQWSRNALAAGKITLKRGRTFLSFRAHVVPDVEKPDILKTYLLRFNWMVWRFFPVTAEAQLSAFAAIAARYPVFELTPDS
jgi:deazaflavin-dependent oxidoreductase (nitroreductase family)